MTKYGYPADRIALESPIYFGLEIKRADIVIWDKDNPTVPYIIVELKKPKLSDGKEQLKSYCNATGAPIGVWTNGNQISYYNRKDPNYFEDITNIPSATQKLADIINEKFTYEDLEKIDKLQDEKAVRVSRTLNLIAGDGKTNVLHLNTLDYSRWDEVRKQEDWNKVFNEGFEKLKDLRPKGSNDYSNFCFDVLMANPPFAGDIKENKIISRYELGKNAKGKWQTKVSRDILFVERNLNFLKPGGRMAVVLPQGRFNNSTDKQIRDFIAERCRILAVVGLHGNTFKPHTGAKTSVLFVQKWDDKLCPKVDDYNIFFATMQEKGKDNSGEKIYVTRSIVEVHDFTSGSLKATKHEKSDFLKEFESVGKATKFYYNKTQGMIDGEEYNNLSVEDKGKCDPKVWVDECAENVLDSHGHLIVKHDLYNHDNFTNDGIAEAFIQFAKKENLSFFQ